MLWKRFFINKFFKFGYLVFNISRRRQRRRPYSHIICSWMSERLICIQNSRAIFGTEKWLINCFTLGFILPYWKRKIYSRLLRQNIESCIRMFSSIFRQCLEEQKVFVSLNSFRQRKSAVFNDRNWPVFASFSSTGSSTLKKTLKLSLKIRDRRYSDKKRILDFFYSKSAFWNE